VKVEQIGDWTLEDRLAMHGPPLVVMFFRIDERRQRMLQGEFRRLAEEHRDARFYEVDLVENPSLATKYSIATLPMVLVFVDGVEVGRHAGMRVSPMVDRVLGEGPPQDDEFEE
jgi:thiol-disulfide isomerase/thioredoxin